MCLCACSDGMFSTELIGLLDDAPRLPHCANCVSILRRRSISPRRGLLLCPQLSTLLIHEYCNDYVVQQLPPRALWGCSVDRFVLSGISLDDERSLRVFGRMPQLRDLSVDVGARYGLFSVVLRCVVDVVLRKIEWQ